MGLKVVHIDRVQLSKTAEGKAMWENVLKPKWEDQAQARGARLLAELTGRKCDAPGRQPTKLRG
jgi:hypothetical protein